MSAELPPQRVRDEPAYVLHRYDWSESSLIVELWSRHHGRVALAAKGAKKPSSQLRGVLLPLQKVLAAWNGADEIRTLKSAHWAAATVMPHGDALFAGLYLNEVVLRTLARDDAHPALFDAYDQAVCTLADEARRPGVLRAFELLWLQGLGVLPALNVHGTTQRALQADKTYRLEPQMGLQTSALAGLNAGQWGQLAEALADGGWSAALLAHCSAFEVLLRPQLRALLLYHSGVNSFRTRQMWLDVGLSGQRARAARTASLEPARPHSVLE